MRIVCRDSGADQGHGIAEAPNRQRTGISGPFCKESSLTQDGYYRVEDFEVVVMPTSISQRPEMIDKQIFGNTVESCPATKLLRPLGFCSIEHVVRIPAGRK